MGVIEKLIAMRERVTPETGAMLVGVDDFEEDGEQLYVIGHYADEEDANKAMAEVKADPNHNGDKLYVYLPKGVKRIRPIDDYSTPREPPTETTWEEIDAADREWAKEHPEVRRADAEWNEEDHPRGEDGKFGEGGGSSKESDDESSGPDSIPSVAFRVAKPEEFKAKFEKAMETSSYKAFVSHYSEAELSKMTTITNVQGTAGVAIKDHGDGRIEATALWSTEPGEGLKMLDAAVDVEGVNYVECYGEQLNTLYERHGFVEESRSEFNTEYASPDWNYEAHDHPDYITMRYAG